jgi:hypothetical protein
MKRIIMLLAVSAILVLALAVPAFAQGKFEQGTEKARSLCSFSGLNDNPEDTRPFEGGRVQSYGDYVKDEAEEPSGRDDPDNPNDQDFDSDKPSPGVACNPIK